MGKRYTNEDKRHAISLARSLGVKEASEMTGISESTIYSWMRGTPTTAVKDKQMVDRTASPKATQKTTYSPAAYKICGVIGLAVGILALLLGLLTWAYGGIVIALIGLVLIFAGRACLRRASAIIAERAQSAEAAHGD